MLKEIWEYFQKEGKKVREKKVKEQKLKPTDYSFLSKLSFLLTTNKIFFIVSTIISLSLNTGIKISSSFFSFIKYHN